MQTHHGLGGRPRPFTPNSRQYNRTAWPSVGGLLVLLTVLLLNQASAAVPRVWFSFGINALEPATPGIVTVQCDVDVTEPLVVYYQITGGTNTTAIPGTDFEPLTGTAVILPDMKRIGFIEIKLLDDLLSEGIEKVTLEILPDPGYYFTAYTNITVWIGDNETALPAVQSWYVATNGVDTNPGTLAQPFGTIRKALTVARYGDTILLRGGTYRQTIQAEPVTGTRLSLLETTIGHAGRELTVRNYSNEVVVVAGSDLVTGWTSTTGPVSGLNYFRAPWTNLSQQVIMNGRVLGHVGWNAPLSAYPANGNPTFNSNALLRVTNAAGVSVLNQNTAHMTNWSYFHDTNANRLYLGLPSGQNPSTSVVEASTRRPMTYFYPFTTFSGITFRHANTLPTTGGWPGVAIGAYNTLTNCTVEVCDFMGVSARDGSRILNCRVLNNGMMGGIVWGTNILVSGTKFLTNHYLPFDLRGEAAGMKVIGQPVYMDNTIWINNEFAYNLGEGLWIDTMKVRDYQVGPTTIRNNYCHDNRSCGIMVEFSDGVWVLNNLSIRNKIRALYYSHAAYSWAFNNTLLAPEASSAAVEIAGGLGGYIDLRPHDIWLYNNIIGTDELTTTPGFTDNQAVLFEKIGECTGATNLFFDYNFYLIRGTRTNGDYFYFNNLDRANGLTGPGCSTEPSGFRTNFAGWQSRGYDTHGYLLTNIPAINSFFLNATQDNYRITAESGAAGSGINAYSYFQTDLDGRPRPPVAPYSMGAYEYLDTVRVTAPDATANEAGTDTGYFQFTRATINPSQPLTVTYAMSGTATSGTDYTALPGSITFAAGVTSVVQNVTAVPDGTSESTETIVLTVSTSTNYARYAANTAATIQLTNSAPALPAAPASVTATPGNRRVILGWSAVPSATSYRVRRATSLGGTYTLVSSPTGTNYTNTGLSNGTTYYYKVSAVNAAGEGPAGPIVSATPGS